MPEFDVVELGPADHPEPGDEAPDFTRPVVNDEYWEDASLSDLAAETDGDEPVVLVFTPMLGSFPAQYVWDELTERGWDERATLVSVTISTPYDVARYLRERSYPMVGVSDPANEIAEDYGIVHDLDGMAGIAEPRPAIFAVDDDLTVEVAWVATEWPEFPPYDDLEEALGFD
ncbi:redoxin domain-containing protein [Natrialbaceae archaeon GCM10025810]|uniref:redoxin domain-containing protein n=1 Tax=Halovalidus salilacus TaxID=3075124 RepID=UPI00361C0860